MVFAALDKLTAPLKKISSESTALGKAMKATNDRLKELNTQQRDLGRFRELHSGLGTTTAKLRDAQQHVNALARQMQQTAQPTRAMTREFNAAVKSAGNLKRAGQQQSEQLQVLRDRLSGAGIGAGNLGTHERRLRTDIAATNLQLAEQQKRLSSIASHQQRVAGARQHADKARAVAGHVATAGIGATVAGGVMGVPIVAGVKEAKHYQTEQARITGLGLGPKVSADAEKYARNLQTYGTSHNENLELVRDAMSVFGDLPHAQMVAPLLAKMKFGNKAMYGEESGAENDRKFMDMLKVIETRGGASSYDKFHEQANMVQKVISATGGRVGPTEWLNLIKTGGIAAKGLDQKAFYFELEPLVQELGGFGVGNGLMSSYNNLYQGRTSKRAAMNLDRLGLIGDHTKVKHDKVGQTSQLNPGALLGADLFKKSQFQWMEQVLLPQLAKHGITEEKQILDTIGSLYTNRKAADLMANMVLQRGMIHKNMKLNAGAYDIDQIDALGQQQASGKELNAAAKLANLKLTMGEKILPLYIQGIELATGALTRLTSFMERNPTIAKAMIVGLGAVAAILVVLGPLMLGLAALIGPYAILTVLFAKMGLSGGVLTPILRGIGSAFLWLGRVLLFVGRAFLFNPIGLAITAIAVAAYLIYRYWEPIKGFFAGLWSEVKAAFDGGILGVSALLLNWSPLGLFYQAFAGVMSWFGIDMPAKFTDFGTNIMQGLVNGITGAMGAVKTTMSNVSDSVVGWFKEKLRIHSPSRVFAELGDFTMQGLTVGLQRSEGEPLGQVGGLAKRLTQLGAGMAIGAATMPALAFDTRPPMAPRAAGAGMVIQGDTIQITIQTTPSMDERAIGRAVAQAMEQRDRQKAARLRSSLSDYNE
ncbi:Phage tail length tape-measure protein [Collimonas arenae]|uniref:Phage tail length tape-measure protein n=1 Tax=Collimonas arenae TaxID=279058 RepID=A0A0A1FEQ3_9BURK|nr:Phage tail length tape-measure protein [Collimonas arenae]